MTAAGSGFLQRALGPLQQADQGKVVVRDGTVHHALTVTDIERLAKAGVVIKFEDIAPQVVPDDDKPSIMSRPRYSGENETKLLVERWLMSNRAAARADQFFMDAQMFPFHLSVYKHDDTFYVFVGTFNGPPVILEDATHLFPSDALMAKLHLLTATESKTP